MLELKNPFLLSSNEGICFDTLIEVSSLISVKNLKDVDLILAHLEKRENGEQYDQRIVRIVDDFVEDFKDLSNDAVTVFVDDEEIVKMLVKIVEYGDIFVYFSFQKYLQDIQNSFLKRLIAICRFIEKNGTQFVFYSSNLLISNYLRKFYPHRVIVRDLQYQQKICSKDFPLLDFPLFSLKILAALQDFKKTLQVKYRNEDQLWDQLKIHPVFSDDLEKPAFSHELSNQLFLLRKYFDISVSYNHKEERNYYKL